MKLHLNAHHVVLNTKFYDPANIYVLGNDERTFEEFFSCDMRPVDQEVQDWYRLSNWLKRYDEAPDV